MKISTVVEQVLRDNMQARGSDKELFVQVLNKMGMNLSPEQERILRSVSLESIRRTRQKLQEQGSYLPPAHIVSERRYKAMRAQQVMPVAKPEHVAELVGSPSAIPWMNED